MEAEQLGIGIGIHRQIDFAVTHGGLSTFKLHRTAHLIAAIFDRAKHGDNGFETGFMRIVLALAVTDNPGVVPWPCDTPAGEWKRTSETLG